MVVGSDIEPAGLDCIGAEMVWSTELKGYPGSHTRAAGVQRTGGLIA